MVAKVLMLAAAVLAVAYALPSPDEVVEVVEAQPLAVASEPAAVAVAPLAVQPIAESRSGLGDLLGLASGGWGSKPLVSVGWAPQQSSGWGWAPKVKYLKFSIPIPVLPRIKFGIKGGLRLHASVHQPKGWGWSSR